MRTSSAAAQASYIRATPYSLPNDRTPIIRRTAVSPFCLVYASAEGADLRCSFIGAIQQLLCAERLRFVAPFVSERILSRNAGRIDR